MNVLARFDLIGVRSSLARGPTLGRTRERNSSLHDEKNENEWIDVVI